MITALTQYLLAAMLSWMPVKNQSFREPEDAALARYESIAWDVASVVCDGNEPPLFAGDDTRAKTALVVLSVAFWESGFRVDIDTGHCAPHECDHGLAFSLWQLHPEDGFIFDGDVYTFSRNRSSQWRQEHASEIYDGPSLIQDRKLAARVALHILRYSVRNAKSLGIYTGEGGNGPKARQRYNHAVNYLRDHPYAN
jgi:hypothetical protein